MSIARIHELRVLIQKQLSGLFIPRPRSPEQRRPLQHPVSSLEICAAADEMLYYLHGCGRGDGPDEGREVLGARIAGFAEGRMFSEEEVDEGDLCGEDGPDEQVAVVCGVGGGKGGAGLDEEAGCGRLVYLCAYFVLGDG